MKEFVIERKDSGQRADKYLARILPATTKSFIYKMIRKKNIVLNDKKMSGSEILNVGDNIKIWFSDETFDRFSKSNDDIQIIDEYIRAYERLKDDIEIIYEDEDFLILNKPAGILSQRSKKEEYTINEWIPGYMISKGESDQEKISRLRPSIVNRLDRNTSGLLLAGKTVYGLNVLSEMVRERKIKKFYLAYVLGQLKGEETLTGHHGKDNAQNTSNIIDDTAFSKLTDIQKKEYSPVITAYKVLEHYTLGGCDITKLQIDLITGKSHQIRAHMASIGHPLLGDDKYGNHAINVKFGLKHQLLHAYRLEFPEDERLRSLSKRLIICQHGNQEVFEDLFSKNL